jgi:hypothetical protein
VALVVTFLPYLALHPDVFGVDLSSYRTSAIERTRFHASDYRLAVAKSKQVDGHRFARREG